MHIPFFRNQTPLTQGLVYRWLQTNHAHVLCEALKQTPSTKPTPPPLSPNEEAENSFSFTLSPEQMASLVDKPLELLLSDKPNGRPSAIFPSHKRILACLTLLGFPQETIQAMFPHYTPRMLTRFQTNFIERYTLNERTKLYALPETSKTPDTAG